MTSTTHTIRRLTRALVLAVALAAFTVPVAAGDNPSDRPAPGAQSLQAQPPDWFERVAARNSQAQPPDWFERAALRASQAQPPDWFERAAVRASQAQPPDWFERAAVRASQAQPPDWFERVAARAAIANGDRRSPDTIDVARAAQSNVTQLDLRSPDTRDAGLRTHTQRIIAATSGNAFDWGDFGLGLAASLGVLLLALLGAGIVAVRGHRGGRIKST